MINNFGEEIETANKTASEEDYKTGPGPFVNGTDGFRTFINSGKLFKWGLDKKNGLVIIDPCLKHSVAAGGGEVITAGHGQLIETSKIWINNDTGHYHTTVESLDLSKKAWEDSGYDVECRERVDFAAALNRLGGNQRCTIL